MPDMHPRAEELAEVIAEIPPEELARQYGDTVQFADALPKLAFIAEAFKNATGLLGVIDAIDAESIEELDSTLDGAGVTSREQAYRLGALVGLMTLVDYISNGIDEVKFAQLAERSEV